jgi:hypothetical protein
MLFLMNDVVLNLDAVSPSPRATAWRYRRLTLDFICELGAELYAELPLLQIDQPERAMRLGAMIVAKDPKINAALFIAPAQGCPIDQVSCRLETIEPGQMAELYARQQAGRLNNLEADRQVWKRLAA